MMNVFDDIGKQMPYKESEEYLEDLINSATEKALRHEKPRFRKRFTLIAASAAASILLIIGIGFKIWHSGEAVQHQSVSPIDEFLNSLSDAEIDALPYYEIEEIPEY